MRYREAGLHSQVLSVQQKVLVENTFDCGTQLFATRKSRRGIKANGMWDPIWIGSWLHSLRQTPETAGSTLTGIYS